METKILHQSEPEPSGAYFKVYIEDNTLIMEGRSTIGEDFRYETKDAFVAFLKTRWSMATFSMSQYLLRYPSKRQATFKGYFNVTDKDEVMPAVSSALCIPEYEVWDISGLLADNGMTPSDRTMNEIILQVHKEWPAILQATLNELS